MERWNALAGWRGLKDLAVRQYFNCTLLAFEADGWGPNQALITNLDLRYEVSYLGADAAPDAIRARLDAGVPALFYLWSPHPFNARFGLNRVQLPAYSPARFQQGLSDYPIDVLEKVASKQLAELIPAVAKLYSRFQIDNSAQESMLATIDGEGSSAREAVCACMRNEENAAVWKAWLPAAQHTCDAGHYAVNETSCAPCPPGSASSSGGVAAACVQCLAGATLRVP